jgi:tetratricopeptide (TPR) repeat protein
LGIDLQFFALARILSDTYAELLSRTAQEGWGVEDTTGFHLGLAEMYHQLDQEEEARRIWNAEQIVLESAKSPVYQPDIDLYLALTYASLGHGKEAIRITNEVLKNYPLSVDAFLGTFRLNVAALVYVRAGAYEKAIDQLELLLSVPSLTSRALYRIDPAWDPLLDHPKFRKLVEGSL